MSLDRFLAAQEGVWPRALAELEAGAKTSHWMWFVFPQIAGLGRSEMARFYAIRDVREARAYLAHPILAARLVQACEAMLAWSGKRSARTVLGGIDAVKLRSCCTLFEAAGGGPVFTHCLTAFFAGERDTATLAQLS